MHEVDCVVDIVDKYRVRNTGNLLDLKTERKTREDKSLTV